MANPALQLLRSHSWQVSIGRLILLLISAGLVGFWLGEVTLVLLVALTIYSFWMLFNLRRLQQGLLSFRQSQIPSDMGVWSDVSHFIHSRHQTGRDRQRRLVRLLRNYREAAQALPDGILVLSNTRQLVWSNAAARRLLGLDPHRHRGQVVDRVIHQPAILDWLNNPKTEHPLIDIAAPFNPDIRLSLRLIPYMGHWLLVVRDISNLLKLEQVRRDFVANVSHELRTPLTVIHGYLELIEPNEHSELAKIVEEMRRQSSRMTQLIEDLLTLARLDSDKDDKSEPVAMTTLLSLIISEAEAVSNGNHQIETEFDSELDLYGSTKDLHSAFSNLVFNAIRYTPPGGRIRLTWQARPNGGCFSVSDTGYGIPSEHIPRITERFYRVSASRSRDRGGTGLGLAIVKHVLNRHQAQLRIESELGIGSTFYCDFPSTRIVSAGALKN